MGYIEEEREEEAANPGPEVTDEEEADTMEIETISVTSLSTSEEHMLPRKADFSLVQEHALTPNQVQAFKARAAAKGKALEGGPPDPEHEKVSAGVGLFATSPLIPMLLLNASKASADAVVTGRCCIYTFDIGGSTLLVAVKYRWAGANKGNVAASRTDDSVAIKAELDAQPDGPKLITGDMHGDTDAFFNFQQMLTEGGWVDMGACEIV